MNFQGYDVQVGDKLFSSVHERHLTVILIDYTLSRVRVEGEGIGVIAVNTDGTDVARPQYGPLFFWHRPPVCIPPKDSVFAKKLCAGTELMFNALS